MPFGTLSLVLGQNVGWHVLWRPKVIDYGTRYLARGNHESRRDFGSWLGVLDWKHGIRSVLVMSHSRPDALWQDLFGEVRFKCRVHDVPLWVASPKAVKRRVRGMLTTGADMLLAARRRFRGTSHPTETVQEAQAVFLRESALAAGAQMSRVSTAEPVVG